MQAHPLVKALKANPSAQQHLPTALSAALGSASQREEKAVPANLESFLLYSLLQGKLTQVPTYLIDEAPPRGSMCT